MSEPTMREALGLDAAQDGDLKGVHRFLNFIEHELLGMTLLGNLPPILTERVVSLHRDARLLGEYVSGLNDAPNTSP